MSPNPYPIFTIPENSKPEDIEKRIKLLIRLYLSQHEQKIAVAVVTHVDALLAYPKYITDIETRCQLRYLSYHWRCLIWTTHPLTNNTKVNKHETNN
ncbi:MAG: hypothetical protein V3U87_17395 [Methylococcaceae bacterium]